MAAQIAAMTSLITADRGRYLWGALRLMEASNTVLLAHSENTNILVDVFAAWFATKNSSGLYIGNKLSMLRLSGTRIKPFGVPSLLNSAINENDEVGFDMFDDMNIGYLMTINSKTEQECVLSMMRSVTGMPINALMISKYVDYASSQECADLVTEKGTLTNPILTDAQAYAKIQDIVNRNLLLFVGTRRIGKIVLSFPDFAIAKTGMTSLEAASAWSAVYTDDLDEVTVTGGITAQ